MAEMDWTDALNDPRILIGLQLLGGSNPRNAPLAGVAQSLMGMKKQKLEAEKWKQQQESDAMRMNLYGQQIEASKAKLAQDAIQQQRQQAFMESIGGYLQGQGGGLPGLGGVAQQQAEQQAPDLSQQQPPAQPPQQAQQPSLFKQRIIPQESGGQHFNPDGSVKLGPVTRFGTRAVGIAQIMESTAPEAAALAGLPYDRNRLYQDPEYNAALGEAYFNKQLQDFGRPDYAAAAYNAGPGRTRRAIEAAAKTGRPELWTAFLPKETRDYVKSTTGAAPTPPPETPLPPTSKLGMRNPGHPLQVAGAMAELAGLRGGSAVMELGKSMEPKQLTPGAFQQDASGNLLQIPDPKGDRAAALAQQEFQLKQQAEARQLAKDNLAATKDQREVIAKKATDRAAFDMVSTNAKSLSKSAEELLQAPGLDRIFGAMGGLISPRLLGGEARNAAANLETLKAKIMNDTLQAIRQSSANGASGYGQLDRNEGENLKQMIATLERSVTPSEVRKSLKEIADHARLIEKRAQAVYETQHGKISMKELPQGSKQVGTKNGVPVYETPDGQRFIKE